jgi:outer membrane protein TolC
MKGTGKMVTTEMTGGAVWGSRPALIIGLCAILFGGLGPLRTCRAQGEPAVAQPGVSGRASAPLTLFDAVRTALDRHPSVIAAKEGRNEARAAERSLDAAIWPSLRLSGSAIRYEKPSLVFPLHSFSITNRTELPAFSRSILQGQLNASYTLWNGGIRKARRREGHARAEGATAALSAAEQSLIANVTSGYLNVLSSKEILFAHDRKISALRADRARIAERLDVGRAARVDLLRIDATIAAADAERIRAASNLELAERNLAFLLEMRPDSVDCHSLVPVAVADSTIEDRGTLYRAALAASPAIEQNRQNLMAARAGLVVARGSRWPAFSLGGNYLGFADIEKAGDANEAEWNALAQVSVPIWTGGQIANDIARARATERRAAAQVRVAGTELFQQIDRALASIAESRARVRSLDLAVTAFNEVVRIQELSYEAGVTTQSDFLNAVADALAAEANLVTARSQEIQSHVELARVMGRLNPEWLERNLKEAR